jgi:uncharacterized protein YbjT (DUF2867 family)
LLTFAEAVAIIAAASGREIGYTRITADELADPEAPEEVIELLHYIFTTVLDGRNASVTDGPGAQR